MNEEQMTNEQKRLFNTFVKILKNEESVKLLQEFLQKLQDNSLRTGITYLEELNSKLSVGNKIDEIHQQAEGSLESIEEIYNAIYNLEDGAKSQVLEDIKNAQENAREFEKDYDKFYGTAENEGIIAKLEKACEQIEANQDKLQELQDFYQRVFEGNMEAEEKSLENTLDECLEQLETLKKQKEEQLTKLYTVQKEKIEGLLPGATAVGLARAYSEERKSADKKRGFWNWVFVISIIIFISACGTYFYFSFTEDFTYVSFLRFLPFTIFSGFFTYYSTKQIAEYKRMESEYAYKQRLNETYIGYENQIENENIKAKLVDIMLDSARFNPSSVLDGKGEIPSLTIMEKMIDLLPIDVCGKFMSI